MATAGPRGGVTPLCRVGMVWGWWVVVVVGGGGGGGGGGGYFPVHRHAARQSIRNAGAVSVTARRSRAWIYLEPTKYRAGAPASISAPCSRRYAGASYLFGPGLGLFVLGFNIIDIIRISQRQLDAIRPAPGGPWQARLARAYNGPELSSPCPGSDFSISGTRDDETARVVIFPRHET